MKGGGIEIKSSKDSENQVGRFLVMF